MEKKNHTVLYTYNGDQLFYEPISKQWFRSSVKEIWNAVIDYKEWIIRHAYWLEYSHFLQLLDLQICDTSELIGNDLDHLDFSIKLGLKKDDDGELYFEIIPEGLTDCRGHKLSASDIINGKFEKSPQRCTFSYMAESLIF